MRIKQLELIGFKSFPQRTVLEIPPGVTGVVGPNGCGKSNIVDAIRWVLGEQSPKHLRGEGMEDVVFKGNDRLAPLGMAEVSLTFDNDGSAWRKPDVELDVSTVPAHFREATEIQITRRFFRSGESEYFINKTPCRLKDVTELFLGTGVGTRAYAIIEQGRVGQLVNARPEELRLFIEEAAGTTLYRNRKLAAERKMERTRENLARVSDILREIDRQSGYLQRQAKKAEECKRLQAEVRELELKLSGASWLRLRDELEQAEAAHRELVAEEERLRGVLQGAETAQRDAADGLAAAERRQVELHEAVAVLDAERESLRERIAMLEREGIERERRAARLAGDIEGARAHQSRLREERGRMEWEREEWARQLSVGEAALAAQEEELATMRAALAGAEAGLERAKAALVEHITREVEARNALIALERRRDDAARQLARLRGEEAEVESRLAAIERQLVERRAEADRLRGELSRATGERDSRAERVRGLAEARRRREREAAALEAALLQARSRLESLEQIQRNYEGYDRGVRAILREQQGAEGVLGVVADVIDIPQPYERAAAAVLGERLQYLIVRGEEDGAGAVEMLRREAGGRASFIPIEPRLDAQKLRDAASLNGTSRRLLDLVRFEERYRGIAESLLGDVVLVPDLPGAVRIWQRNGIHVTLVTPDGDVVGSSGVISGGSDRPAEEDFLARRREIESLRVQVSEGEERVRIVREEIERIATEIASSEEALRALGEDAHRLTLQIVAVEKDVERLELERPQCISRRDVVRYEIDALVTDETVAAEEFGATRCRVEELAVEHQLLEREVAAQRAVQEEMSRGVESRALDLTALKVRVAEQRERQAAAAASAESLARQIAEVDVRVEALAADMDAARREREEMAAAAAGARERVEEQGRRREALQGEVGAAAEESRRRAELLRECERRVRDSYGAIDELRGRRSAVEVTRSEVRLRAEHLARAMREKYETDIAEYAATAGEIAVGDSEAERLDALKQRLLRIGDVNLGAIEELRELEERGGYLRAQKEDLERSLGDLERTIQKLNRVSRTRFAETFARANEMFQKVFPRLFRGGEARLVLTDESNLLETGVEIVVRPPGKRLDSMALLSGGEKALVAVSLIFSLFLINPAPFCVLDEVDAPLDDANIGRFSQLIREMSDRLQFMIITHNKRTMQAADALYGITMQEAGVSKVVSVRLGAE